MEYLLKLEKINFRVGNSGAVVTVDTGLSDSSVLFVNGPSGSGKTTILRILSKLQRGISGQVYLNGRSWGDFSVYQWRRLVHLVPQKPVLFNGTVWDNLLKPFSISLVQKEVVFNKQEAERLLSILLPHNTPEQAASTLSGGEAARLALLRAFLLEPKVLLLDEPTAALDLQTATLVLELLIQWLKEKPHRGIIMVSHGHTAAMLTEITSTTSIDLGIPGKGGLYIYEQ